MILGEKHGTNYLPCTFDKGCYEKNVKRQCEKITFLFELGCGRNNLGTFQYTFVLFCIHILCILSDIFLIPNY